MKIEKVTLTLQDILNMYTLADTKLKGKWAKNVPIVPGDPKYLTTEFIVPQKGTKEPS